MPLTLVNLKTGKPIPKNVRHRRLDSSVKACMFRSGDKRKVRGGR